MNNGIKELFRFGVVGAFATLLHYGLYWLLMRCINVNVAYATGYIVSFIANFYLTAYFTFKVKPSLKKAIGMGGAHLVNFLLHMLLLNLFLYIGIEKQWAPIPVFAIAIPVNFILVRFVFKNKRL
ncbi:MAG: GtrA family protein [Marinifilaceae bacterium]|nr:GtrA family protein [Marinifilaceae bacterium]